MPVDDLKKLYSASSRVFSDLGTFEEFQTKMSTEQNAKKFHQAAGATFSDLGDFDSFWKRVQPEKSKLKVRTDQTFKDKFAEHLSSTGMYGSEKHIAPVIEETSAMIDSVVSGQGDWTKDVVVPLIAKGASKVMEPPVDPNKVKAVAFAGLTAAYPDLAEKTIGKAPEHTLTPLVTGDTPELSTGTQVAIGAVEAVSETATGLASPFNVALILGGRSIGGIAGRLMHAAFVADMAVGAIKSSIDAYDAYKKGDARGLTRNALHAIITAMFAGLAGRSAIKGGIKGIKEDLKRKKKPEISKDLINEITEAIKAEEKTLSPEQKQAEFQSLRTLADDINERLRIKDPQRPHPPDLELEDVGIGVLQPDIQKTPFGRDMLYRYLRNAVEEFAAGVKEIVKGTGEVLGTFGAFSEESYMRSKPHFIKAWNAFKAAGKSFPDFELSMRERFGDSVIPYLNRFKSDQVSIPNEWSTIKDDPLSKETLAAENAKTSADVAKIAQDIKPDPEFDSVFYDGIFNVLRKGMNKSIEEGINPDAYLRSIENSSPELKSYIDEFRSEMNLGRLSELEFPTSKEATEAVFSRGEVYSDRLNNLQRWFRSNAIELDNKLSDISTGRVQPTTVYEKFLTIKPKLDQAWNDARRAGVTTTEFLDAISKDMPKEAGPVLLRWIWSAPDIKVGSNLTPVEFSRIPGDRVENANIHIGYISSDGYTKSRSTVKKAANAVSAYMPLWSKIVRSIRLIPQEEANFMFDKPGVMGDFDRLSGEIRLREIDPKLPAPNGKTHLQHYINSIAHEIDHNWRLSSLGPKKFKALFPRNIPYRDRPGEILAFQTGDTIERMFEIKRTGYAARLANAVKEVAKGLQELAKGSMEVAGTLGAFSEEGYARAKPHFAAAWKEFKSANRPFWEFEREMRNSFGDEIIPYLRRFGADQGLAPGDTFNQGESQAAELEGQIEADAKFNRGLTQSLKGAFDVEAKFPNKPKTGLAAKNWFSVKEAFEEEALYKVGKPIRQMLKSKDDLPHVVLTWENPEWIKRVPEADRPRIQHAAELFGKYFLKSKQDYLDRGIRIDFKERLKSEINEMLKSAEDPRVIDQLTRQLAEVEKFNFVHIPYNMWFNSASKKNPLQAYKVLRLLNTKKRTTFRISDLLDEGVIALEDINPFEILASYGARKARDMASLDLLRAAESERLAVSLTDKGYQNYVPIPGYIAPLFKGKKVHPILADYIYDIRKSSGTDTLLRKIQSGYIASKMAAFYNFTIMPMLDSIQGIAAGSIRPTIGGAIDMFKGFKSAFTRDVEYFKAMENGASSTPYNNPFQSYLGLFDSMSKFGVDRAYMWLKRLVPGGLKTIYNASHNLSWILDRGFRMTTYNYFRRKGYSVTEAAQLAAKYHGDYASVPAKTRQALNMVFFTPTFKIVMGKLYLDMLKGAANVVRHPIKSSNMDKHYARSLIYTTVIVAAFDALMVRTFNFEREEFGRKYKRMIDTPQGLKEFVVAWNSHANMWLKYIQRAANAAGPGNTETWLASFLKSNRFELHPLYNVAYDLAQNKTAAGEQIYSRFDDNWEKAAKSLRYSMVSIVRLFETGMSPTETSDAWVKPADVNKVAADEFGKLAAIAMKPFTFQYIKGSKEQRMMYKLSKIKEDFAKDLRQNRIDRSSVKNYLEEVDEIIEEGMGK